MSFKSNSPLYSMKWLKQLSSFISEYNLFTKETPLLIAVSGGIDSMALLLSIYQLRTFGYSNTVRIISVNHGTRPGQKDESALVASTCKEMGFEFISVKLNGLDITKNFEFSARNKRYEVFEKHREKNGIILLGHHLDDSFEWSLMQSFRSSETVSSLGIPVRNKSIARPFMCFSKEHIINFMNCYDLEYLEDPTNTETKYERNFLRLEVIENIKKRYPNYIKHYVHRQNELARKLGVHLIKSKSSNFELILKEDSALIFSLNLENDASGLEELLIKALKHLNPNSRGKINSQLEKIVKAMQNSKRGPLALTNSWEAHIDFNLVFISKWKNSNKNLINSVKAMYSLEQYREKLDGYIRFEAEHELFPFPVFVCGKRLDERKFKIVFEERFSDLQKHSSGQLYPALKLLREWSKKRNRHRVLQLSFPTCLNSR